MRSAKINGRRAILLFAVALPVLSIVLSACRAPGSTRPIAKIGLIAPFEGLHRALGYDVLYAAQLAVKEWNADAPPMGWGVELVALDDGHLPEGSRIAAEKLALDADVVGVVGPFSWDTGQTIGPPLFASRIPWIAIAPISDTLLDAYRPFAFRYYGSAEDMVDLLRDYAKSTFPHHPLAVFTETVVPRIFDLPDRLPVEHRVWHPQNGAEAFAHLSPDQPVLLDGTSAWTAQAIVALRVAGRGNPILAGPDAGSEVVVQRAGEAAEGVWWIGALPDIAAGDLSESFVADYTAIAGHSPDPYALLAYDAVRALLRAIAESIERRGEPERLAVAEALSRLELDGVSGATRFDEHGGAVGLPARWFVIHQDQVVHPAP